MQSHMTHTYAGGFLEGYEERDVSWTASSCRRAVSRVYESLELESACVRR